MKKDILRPRSPDRLVFEISRKKEKIKKLFSQVKLNKLEN